MKYILAFLALSSVAWADLDFTSDDPHFTYTPTSDWEIIPWTGSSGCGTEFLMGNDAAVVSFTFPVVSTFVQWWGFQKNSVGSARICIDNAPTSECQVVSYYNATTGDADSPRMLVQQTGLTNATHTITITITITNLIDPTFSTSGQLTVDRITLAGTTYSPPPIFPPESWVTTVEMASPYFVSLTLGGHSPPLNVMLDTGASGAWTDWIGCSDLQCGGVYSRYVPSSAMYNFTIEDATSYAAGDMFSSWRVNDTVAWGNVTAVSTFGAAYHMTNNSFYSNIDGNFGMAKSYFVAKECTVYPNFIEAAYLSGAIKNPVLALFQVYLEDQAQGPINSVLQIGGINRNRFTGSVDWIPMTDDSWWITPSQIRTVKASANAPPTSPTFTHPTIIFDTGDSNAGPGVPTAHATQDANGNWWVDCGAVLLLNMKGNLGRTYTMPLGISYIQQNGLCEMSPYDEGDQEHWIVGLSFLAQYYTIFHYKSNLLGLATKNMGLDVTTPVAFIGQA